jgi:hypothetical protein
VIPERRAMSAFVTAMERQGTSLFWDVTGHSGGPTLKQNPSSFSQFGASTASTTETDSLSATHALSCMSCSSSDIADELTFATSDQEMAPSSRTVLRARALARQGNKGNCPIETSSPRASLVQKTMLSPHLEVHHCTSTEVQFCLETCNSDDFFISEAEESMALQQHDEELTYSVGSVGHHAGKCTPCKFHRSKRGCRAGLTCNLCHFPHEDLTHSAIRRAMRFSAQAKRERVRIEQQDREASLIGQHLQGIKPTAVEYWDPLQIPLGSLLGSYN